MGEEIQNRTFLMPDRTVKLSMTTPLRVNFPPNGDGGKAHPGRLTTMGQADPALVKSDARQPYMRSFAGYRWASNNFVPETVQEWAEQRFANYATPWEKQWSVLINRVFPMAPMVDDSGLVIAHIGTVSTGNIATFQMPPPAGKTQYLMTSDTIRNFGMTTTGFSDSTGVFLTTPDGQVLTRIGETTTRGVQPVDISPLDLFFAVKTILDLGAAGIKMLTVLQRKAAARQILKGPTRDLIIDASHTGMPVAGVYSTTRGLGYQVLQVGDAIPNTNVPQWLRIKVGSREFLVGRDAMALDRAGNPMGSVTKHLADWAKKAAKKGQIPEAQFPMNWLAEGLQEAERQIMRGMAPARRREKFGSFNVAKKSPVRGPQLPGEHLPNVSHAAVGSFEFGIDTYANPWKVFHVQIKS